VGRRKKLHCNIIRIKRMVLILGFGDLSLPSPTIEVEVHHLEASTAQASKST
jgi:hypothetical protein